MTAGQHAMTGDGIDRAAVPPTGQRQRDVDRRQSRADEQYRFVVLDTGERPRRPGVAYVARAGSRQRRARIAWRKVPEGEHGAVGLDVSAVVQSEDDAVVSR